MNAYEKAQSLGLTGTDAEIVAVLKTLTTSDIPVSKVAIWLRENLLWYWTSPTSMGGAFQNVVENPSTPQNIKDGLGLFFSAVFGDGAAFLQTTVPQWAGLVAQVMAGLIQLAPQSAALVDSFYSLDGDRPYKDLTVEEFSSQKTQASLRGSDCLLSINRTNGVLSVSVHVTRDGQQVRLALLTEGIGSASDQALTSAIETAIDNWLQAGV